MGTRNGEAMDIYHRIGSLEARVDLAQRASDVHADQDLREHADHERRLRAQEFLTAKVIGASIVGGALVNLLGWLLNYFK